MFSTKNYILNILIFLNLTFKNIKNISNILEILNLSFTRYLKILEN